MALPLLAGAASSLLRRYGLKALTSEGKKKLKEKTIKGLTKPNRTMFPPSVVDKAMKKARRKQVAGNIGVDVGGGAILESIFADEDMPEEASKLGDYIKKNKPKLWKEFQNSEYDDIKKFLKSKKA